ncbi:MAG: beta-ketoacyl synthase chain length factor [Spirochaetes bacterium]|nr:beta-ketoacyl synthase chain length factor [Spirochaetota bacterium]
MIKNELYITRFSAWAPGIKGAAEWDEWALGKREMLCSAEAPEITFTDSMFRRRLGQISKMTIQVTHDLLPISEKTKMVFVSFRGELSKQYKINKMQIEENTLMPAAFSLSVFNAPPALASIALGLKGGYSALYPGGDSFLNGFVAAKAALLTGESEELAIVYADEEVPPEYTPLLSKCLPPFAFSFLLAKKPCSGALPLLSLNKWEDCPAEFLKSLFLSKVINVSS